MSYWDFGDGATLTNQPCASHVWSTPGDYSVVLTAFNESNPEGVRASFAVQVRTPPLHYVALASTNPVPPFLSWETAAADIQSPWTPPTPQARLCWWETASMPSAAGRWRER